MAPFSSRPCLYKEDGFTWQTPKCEHITTMNEAKLYMRARSNKCINNPAVVQETEHKREREVADTARCVAIELAEVN